MQATFNFKDQDEEFKDDELKLPDDLFSKFDLRERKSSNGSDDMVKLDENNNLERSTDSKHSKGSPLQNISVDEEENQGKEGFKRDFESTSFQMAKKLKKNNLFEDFKMDNAPQQFHENPNLKN